MIKIQRVSWIGLIIILAWAIISQLSILPIFLEGPSFLYSFSLAPEEPSFLHLFSFACLTIIGGLSWLLLLFFNKTRNKKVKVEFDERDKLILIRSALIGYIVLLIYFIAACIYTWLTAPPNRSISVNVMPITIVEGIVVFIFVVSVTTLVQHGRAGKNVE
ncbi:MAG: hypothetical protein ACYS6K_19830 [Planctomycetota bacterium]|jgi:hypothetical protein